MEETTVATREDAAQGTQSRSPGLTVERRFTTEGTDPYDSVSWELRDAVIGDASGNKVFEQRGVEVPSTWSQTATNVVVSKYFRGHLGTPERERSVRQLIGRVCDTITQWGWDDGYFDSGADMRAFRDDLTWLCLNQYMAFNSPVWFNVGVEQEPQCSACFINSVDDTMESILGLAKTEGLLFKWGSGTGSNLSPIRSSKEKLRGGGTASGPVSFMRGFDAFAGVIKSGGKTRRAAKMVILDIDHPDVVEFISCKADEEQKAWALIDAGYDGGFNVAGGAYDSVFFQNSNNSVRVSDAFMEAVLADGDWSTRAVTTGAVVETLKARDLMAQIAEAAWLCGDPGMQYDTTINDWHTCPGTDRIYASNPCVTGDTLVATARGWQRIDTLLETPSQVVGADGALHAIEPAFQTGVKPVYRLSTRAGYELKLTADHKVFTLNRGDVPACELSEDDILSLGRPAFGSEHLDARVAELLGLMVGGGAIADEQGTLTLSLGERPAAQYLHRSLSAYTKEHATGARAAGDLSITERQGALHLTISARCVLDALASYAHLDEDGAELRFLDTAFTLDRDATAAVLRGLFTAGSSVSSYGDEGQYVALNSSSLGLLQQVQLMLLSFGIKAELLRNRRPLGQRTALLSDGRGGRRERPVQQRHTLRIGRTSRVRFEQSIGFLEGSARRGELAQLSRELPARPDPLIDRVATLELIGEQPVYDLTEPDTHHFVAAGLVVHNCSEYMFLDNSACNLASLNLMKFRTADGGFDVQRFRWAARLAITAQEILIERASYPTPAIERNSHDYRPLGLGYANLGALLMARGLPYDSEEGRAYAGAITALMHGEANLQSSKLAAVKGSFAGYAKNEAPFLRVMGKHREAAAALSAPSIPADMRAAITQVWDEVLAHGAEHGFRNAQVTVLAPTGTIGFMMDCDTTGVEPDIALIKYKKLVGGGLIKIVNQTVPLALEVLGYSGIERETILAYLDREETIEGAPHLKAEHVAVFDCAFKARKGKRTIAPMGHVRMMGAVQPFLSGAISKTVNMPHSATPAEIADVYIQAWKLGLKAIAIYRDGCKRTQPLNTGRDEVAAEPEKIIEKVIEYRPVRRKLPAERTALTHKFNVGGHEGYITVGLYDDGTPGELFLTMAKEGSTVSGLMDAFATSVSMALQYGVPVQVLCDKFAHMRFEPSGYTGSSDIPYAKSLMDYIFRWMDLRFGEGSQQKQEALPFSKQAAETVAAVKAPPATTPTAAIPTENPHEREVFTTQADAPPCHVCGSIMVRSGACYKCFNCGATSGCS